MVFNGIFEHTSYHDETADVLYNDDSYQMPYHILLQDI